MTAGNTINPAQRGQTGPKGTDWEAAYRYYCEKNADGTVRTLEDVGIKFNVKSSYVRTRAARENWLANRQKLGKEHTKAVESQVTAEILQANKLHLETWQSLRAVPLRIYAIMNEEILEAEKMRKENKDSAWKKHLPHPYHLNSIILSIGETIKGERVVLGLPNEVTKSDITNTLQLEQVSPDALARGDEAFARASKNKK